MCYHTSTPEREKLQQLARQSYYKLYPDYQQIFHVNGFSRPFLPVRLNNAQDEINPARWKLLPFWIKTDAEAKKSANTLNADSDVIFNRNSYSRYAAKNHGLLYVDGFYEPHQPDDEVLTETHYIYRPNHEIFTLGIIYAPWTDKETGEHYNTFSIITVPANPLLAKVHNKKKRMPLIISEAAQNDWLNTNTKEGTQSFFKPYSGVLEEHRVIPVTRLRNIDTNVPETQDPI